MGLIDLSILEALLEVLATVLILVGIVFIIIGFINLVLSTKEGKNRIRAARKKIIKGIIILLVIIVIWSVVPLLTAFC